MSDSYKLLIPSTPQEISRAERELYAFGDRIGLSRQNKNYWVSIAWLLLVQQEKKSPQSRKRETKWDDISLYVAVCKKAESDNCNISDACRRISRRAPWNGIARPRSDERKPWEILRERFIRVQKKLAETLPPALQASGEKAMIDVFASVDPRTGEILPKSHPDHRIEVVRSRSPRKRTIK